MRLAFADSEVAAVEADGGTLRIRFAAAAAQPTLPGEEAGWLLGLVLELRGASWTGDPAACFGRLRDGALSDAVSRFGRLELPFGGPGPWRAEFEFANGTVLAVRAAHAAASGGRFRPSLAC